jgi:protein-S-isoprenylcysteine O-methyltransferase Ste14
MTTLGVVAIAAVLFAKFAWGEPLTAYRVAGLAILIPAFVLFVIARIQLGQAFSVRAKASELVTTGLYARIRNPIYVFGALMIAGLIIWSGKFWFLLAFAILLPLQIYRSRQEEQVLAEKFGPAYVEYKQKTWF